MDWVFGEETDNTLSPDTDSEEEDTDMQLIYHYSPMVYLSTIIVYP